MLNKINMYASERLSLRDYLILLTAFPVLMFASLPAHSAVLGIERHESAGTIDLVPGAARGSITQPLLTGTIAETGQEVLFIVTDASDRDFAEMFGAIRADSLDEAPDAAVETALFEDGKWTFNVDAGLVIRVDPNTLETLPPVANPEYSPLKRIQWNGKTVTVNVPFIKWGDGAGQQLVVDPGGIPDSTDGTGNPGIRKNPPSPFFVVGGPSDGAPEAQVLGEAANDRYKGGQLLNLDLDAMTVTIKLHRGTFDHPESIPYYTQLEASKAPPAGFTGVIFAPKLGNLGRFGDNDSVGRIAQFSNGVRIENGGPNRFQQGITSYRGGQQGIYSPMWHISWVFFDCNRNGVFFDTARNVGEGATPTPGSGDRFDPTIPATFDPFGMDDKGVSCVDFAAEVTGNADGFVADLNQLNSLIDGGFAIQTEGPAGLRLDSPLQPPLIVNCPVPVTVQ